MESTDRWLKRRARWLAVATTALLLVSLLPLAEVAVAVVLPDHLAFNPDPGGAVKGGEAFPAQPKVEVRYPGETVATTDTTTVVTLAIKSGGSAGASLICTNGNSRTVVAGVATFAGCRIDKSGTGYVLTATSSPAYTFADTGSFNVVVGSAAKLGFTVPPAGGVKYGQDLATQPTVTIQDAGGNTITGPAGDLTSAITLSITPGTPTVGGPGTVTCSATSTVGGVAAFSGCRVDTAGAGYRLHAGASVIGSGGTPYAIAGDSAAFTINGGTATKLDFRTQPGGGTGGIAWVQQPVVQVQDAAGSVVVQDSATVVTLTIASPSPVTGATLSCTNGLSKTVTNGEARFEGCKIDRLGAGYTLTAADTTSGVAPHPYTPATSTAFAITAGAAAKLAFTAQPATAAAGGAFPTQPVVAIQDAGGNPVTSAPATAVTLAIGANPGGAVLTCSGGNPRTTVGGVATFSGCSLSASGTGYTLTAAASGLTGAATNAFTVTSMAASLVLSASSRLVNTLDPVSLTVQFASLGEGRTVTLQKKTALDPDWIAVVVLTAGTSGTATTAVAPSVTTSYRAYYAGATDMSSGASNVLLVGVRHSVTLKPKTPTGTITVARGTRKTYSATLGPITPGQRVTFQIFRRIGSAWVFQTSATKTCDSGGQATFAWTWKSPGQWYVRARANTTSLNTTAYSNLEKVRVP